MSAAEPPELEVGEFPLRPLGRSIKLEGETASGAEASGRGDLYELTGPEGLHLTLRHTRWETGEQDVVACERHQSPERFDTLVERLRLAVLDYGSPYVELRQGRLRSNGRAGLFNADLAELDAGAGVAVAEALRRHGATEIGTRRELLHDEGRTANRCGALFEEQARLVPVLAYVLTRVAPVARRVEA